MARKRITLDLDEGLLHLMDSAATRGHLSRNQFVVESLTAAVREAERRQVDLEFMAMESDLEYCKQLSAIETELSPESDRAWDLLSVGDIDS